MQIRYSMAAHIRLFQPPFKVHSSYAVTRRNSTLVTVTITLETVYIYRFICLFIYLSFMHTLGRLNAIGIIFQSDLYLKFNVF